ncbi:MAG: hypothetical protein V3T83_19255 [Acidobacteriota bacterium]
MSGRPDLSVVVTARGPECGLDACLRALAPDKGRTEVIVASCGGYEPSAQLQSRHVWARFQYFPQPLSPPQLRLQAARLARADILAFSKDSVCPAPGWCRSLIRLHRRYPQEVIGGAIRFASRPDSLNWAAFLCEYAPFLPGSLSALEPASSNLSYKRRLLERFPELFSEGLWETLLHRQLRLLGVGFRLFPELEVDYLARFRWGGFLLQRYHFSRSFAAQRARRASAGLRMLRIAAAPLLPFLLTARLWRQLSPHPQYRGIGLRCLPWLALFFSAGAWGELRGCLQGEGQSGCKVQ